MSSQELLHMFVTVVLYQQLLQVVGSTFVPTDKICKTFKIFNEEESVFT